MIFRYNSFLKQHRSSNYIKLFYLILDLFGNVTPFKSEVEYASDYSFYVLASDFDQEKFEKLNMESLLEDEFFKLFLSET